MPTTPSDKPARHVEEPAKAVTPSAPETQGVSVDVASSTAWLLAESERTILDAIGKRNTEMKQNIEGMMSENDFKDYGALVTALSTSIDQLRSMIKEESSQSFKEAINAIIQEREELKEKARAQAQEKWIEEKVSGTWAPSDHLQAVARHGRWVQWLKRAF